MDDGGNGRIETGNNMADRVPGTETGQVPGSKDTRKSEHYRTDERHNQKQMWDESVTL